MSKHPIEIIMPDVIFEQQVQQKRQTNVARVKAILNNEYNDWLVVRQYVRENMWKLKGQMFPIEVASIQDLGLDKDYEKLNCIIINDMELLPYLRVFELLKEMEEKKEKLEKLKSLDAMLCPKCDTPLEDKPNQFHWRGRNFNGLVCPECKALWDYDDQFVKYTQAFANLEKKGRVSGT